MRLAERCLAALLLAGLLIACGAATSRPTAPAAGSAPGFESQVESVTDGDTIRINPPVLGATSVRFLNIDAPERNGDTQEPWTGEALVELRGLLPVATRVRLDTGRPLSRRPRAILAARRRPPWISFGSSTGSPGGSTSWAIRARSRARSRCTPTARAGPPSTSIC